MKKLLFLLISFLIVGAVALQSSASYNELVMENAKSVSIRTPMDDCRTVLGYWCRPLWGQSCSVMLPPDIICTAHNYRFDWHDPID